jgi:hypothetical protein
VLFKRGEKIMEKVIGILLLISFIGLAVYCIKGYNLMIGFLIMATIWTILPLLGNHYVTNPQFIAANKTLIHTPLVKSLTAIFQTAPENWGVTLVNVCWGAWFGRVLLETGIASTLIRNTVELGGDKPLFTITLLNIVVAIIFTSMTGAGPVIAIGVIVLPILLSLGVPKAIALFSFMGAVAAGIYLNPVNFAQYQAFFQDANGKVSYVYSNYVSWGFAALVIMLIITTITTGIALKAKKTSHAWAAQTQKPSDSKNAPAISLIAPVLPVLGVIFLKLPVIFGFIVAGFFALAVCGKLKEFDGTCRLVNKMFCDGVIDTAPLVGFLLTLPMFNAAAGYAAPYFKSIIGGVVPKSPLVICIVFAIFAILGLFRGPMTLVGCGAATLGVIKTFFPVALLYPLFAIPTITMNIGSCITQSWVAWGLGYTKVEAKDFLRLSIPNGWVTSIILCALTYFMVGMHI